MASLVVWRLGEATREQAARLRRSSLTDGLTGVLNRRGLLSGFPGLVREAERQNTVVGVVLMDVDHFKRINDEYGHTVGDEVLRRICAVASRVVGDRGLLARTGGEELAVVVAGAPEPLAEQIRDGLATGMPEPPVTVSMGVVSMAPDAIGEHVAGVGPARRRRPGAVPRQAGRPEPDPSWRGRSGGRAATGPGAAGHGGGTAADQSGEQPRHRTLRLGVVVLRQRGAGRPTVRRPGGRAPGRPRGWC